MAQTPEGKVKDRVKKLLKEKGVWYFMPVAGPFAVHGIPDFICCHDGKFMGIETKAPGKINNVTPSQERVIQEIRDHNGVCLVIDNITQLEEFFTGRKEKT